jgi:transcriptional regulator with XRE-family HTH domain
VPEEIIFAQVLDDLLTDKFRRNRAALAKAAHVSPSALSQYTRRKATPSLEVLVHLAGALDVSLDYLVFGRERSASSPEVGYLSSHVEAALRAAETRSAAITDLVSRTGARLGESIQKTVAAILEEETQPGGALNADEVWAVERCSQHTTIVTTTLDMDVLILDENSGEPATGPSLFSQLIADNILSGSTYDYLLPRGEELDQTAALLRQQLSSLCDQGDEFMADHLRIFRVTSSCVPGFVMYKLQVSKLRRLEAAIYDRIQPFLYVDPANETIAYAATLEPVSRSYQYFALMQVSRVQRLLAEVVERRETLLAEASPGQLSPVTRPEPG